MPTFSIQITAHNATISNLSISMIMAVTSSSQAQTIASDIKNWVAAKATIDNYNAVYIPTPTPLA